MYLLRINAIKSFSDTINKRIKRTMQLTPIIITIVTKFEEIEHTKSVS